MGDGAKRTLPSIQNDEEHDAALQEIERLWGAEPGTPESDRLEALAVIVDAYERQRWPD